MGFTNGEVHWTQSVSVMCVLVFLGSLLNKNISICGLQIVELMLRYLLVLENSLVEGLVLISGMKLNFRR